MKAFIMLMAKTESPNRHHSSDASINPTEARTAIADLLTPG
jgi:hypothetical protein